MKNADIHAEVADYYAAKLSQYGETPRGVDWNGAESQLLRFEQLCRVIDAPGAFSLNDLGCGYGALFDFLAARHTEFTYAGCDVSAEMIRAARHRHVRSPNAQFAVAAQPPVPADYTVASGVFNVKLKRGAEWAGYIADTLDDLNVSSLRGFAFNCLTSYMDQDKARDYLYYADPCILFDLCKRRYARDVALLHDYGLYEFTIVVRKRP